MDLSVFISSSDNTSSLSNENIQSFLAKEDAIFLVGPKPRNSPSINRTLIYAAHIACVPSVEPLS
jgi:hypothetical protein